VRRVNFPWGYISADVNEEKLRSMRRGSHEVRYQKTKSWRLLSAATKFDEKAIKRPRYTQVWCGGPNGI